jgi:hypothetical protein
MNERIRELAKQADEGYTGDSKDDMGAALVGNDAILKFAELIVIECANYINQRTLDWDADLRWIFNDGSGDMAVDVDDLLNRHFGVEE